MDRTVHRIESTPAKARQDPPRAFSSYDDAANIVLLGDPGAGKTPANGYNFAKPPELLGNLKKSVKKAAARSVPYWQRQSMLDQRRG